jgi:2-polyprenyl-3-methyl-5-hydroxy-6-metoxy-1,4-benzoquinol methylase
MAFLLDPEGTETRVLHSLASFADKDVLEVGCGDGRLTWRYAAATRSVLAIDPKADAVARAEADRPDDLRGKVSFRAADVTSCALPEGAFDVALLSWSL